LITIRGFIVYEYVGGGVCVWWSTQYKRKMILLNSMNNMNSFVKTLKGVLYLVVFWITIILFDKHQVGFGYGFGINILFIMQYMMANETSVTMAMDIRNFNDIERSTSADEMIEYIKTENYNRMLNKSMLHIWKKFANESQKEGWHDAENEEIVKHIISQFLPDHYLYMNNLLVEYKEVPIDSIPSEALEHLEIAIPARTIINELIDEIYNEIKNEYMNEINHEVIA
jgi:hypothetical protein